MKLFPWALTDLKGCNFKKERVMLCLKNMRKQLPNCLNTTCFHEATSQASFVVGLNAGILTCPTTGRLALLQGDWWRKP